MVVNVSATSACFGTTIYPAIVGGNFYGSTYVSTFDISWTAIKGVFGGSTMDYSIM
jgi:hypothetical protein